MHSAAATQRRCSADFGDLHRALQQRADAQAPASVREVLQQPGQPLDAAVRRPFERQLGQDFSHVRVHTGSQAAQSARQIGALAYTAGPAIVFGAQRYDPASAAGQRLLAHELTHTAQQAAHGSSSTDLRLNGAGESQARQAEHAHGPLRAEAVAAGIQRAPDPAAVREFDARIRALRRKRAYRGLAPVPKGEFDQIVDIARQRDNPLYYATKLEVLLATPEESSAKQSAAMAKETQDAADREAARLKDPAAAAARRKEENVSANPFRVFKPAVGLDRKTTFLIDARDPTDVAVHAKVRPLKAGSGGDTDVANVKSLEDAIEKRSSTFGYSLDVEFVDRPGGDVFDVNVDTANWTVATNWVGDDVGLAHELHHLLGLKEDRYDYIQSHHANAKMKIKDRIHWFRVELSKVIDNNPDSMMNSGNNLPLDDDICMLAGNASRADIEDCVKKREAARAGVLQPALDRALARVRKADALPDSKVTPLAAKVFSKPPSLPKLRDALKRLPLQLRVDNLRLASPFNPDCVTRPAFAFGAAPHIRLCPVFLRLAVGPQSLALLVEALHLGGIGSMTDPDCAQAGCADACGDKDNAKAWARYIECGERA